MSDYITEDKKKELSSELENLKGPERKKILEALAFAKSLGDLSENAEYHQAREDQGKLEERIRKIEGVLKNSIIIAATGGEFVTVGSTVLVQKANGGEEKKFMIVGSEEADTTLGKISNHSPFGNALLGKKKGDMATFNTPSGPVNYKIIEIS